jgi:hypothetical protein
MSITGNAHSCARFIDSYNTPCPSAPSPKKQATTRFCWRYFEENAAPAASAALPPTNGVRAEIARVGIGSVQGTALPLAVPGRLPSDVVLPAERTADADGDRLFPDRQVREARHQRAGVEIVHTFFEEPNRRHLPVHPEQSFLHRSTPAARASA